MPTSWARHLVRGRSGTLDATTPGDVLAAPDIPAPPVAIA
jgi:hypothetical protein